MTASHDIFARIRTCCRTQACCLCSAAKHSVLERFSTPLWISIGISIIALAVLATFA
jgi:hypothetical protein